MKKLFIFYSLTGNGDYLSAILEYKGYEIRKVVEKKKMPNKFFWRVLTGGFRAGMRFKGKLINFDKDISNYDEIVIGSPIWNGRFPPAINSVLDQVDFSNKKLTFIFYSGSGEAPKANKIVMKKYPGSKVIILKEPKKYEEEISKIDEII